MFRSYRMVPCVFLSSCVSRARGPRLHLLPNRLRPALGKVRPCAHPLEAVQPPGWSAQRHRRGRRLYESRLALSQAWPGSHYNGPDARRNFAKKSPAFACRAAPEPAVARRLARATQRVAIVQLDARLQTINRESSARRPPPYGPDCCSKTAICDRAPLRRPLRRAQLRCCSAGYGAFSEKEPRPTVSGRAPGKFFRFNSSLKRYISLLRRGARWFERTGLKPAGLRFRRGGAPKGRLIGLTGEKPAPSARQRNPVQTRALRLNDFAPKAWRAPTRCSTGPPVATCMVRALAEIDQTTLGCLIDFLLQQARAGLEGTALGPGRPHVPWTGDATHRYTLSAALQTAPTRPR